MAWTYTPYKDSEHHLLSIDCYRQPFGLPVLMLCEAQ